MPFAMRCWKNLILDAMINPLDETYGVTRLQRDHVGKSLRQVTIFFGN